VPTTPYPFHGLGGYFLAPKLVLAVYPAPFVLVICGRDSLSQGTPFRKTFYYHLEFIFKIFIIFANYIAHCNDYRGILRKYFPKTYPFGERRKSPTTSEGKRKTNTSSKGCQKGSSKKRKEILIFEAILQGKNKDCFQILVRVKGNADGERDYEVTICGKKYKVTPV